MNYKAGIFRDGKRLDEGNVVAYGGKDYAIVYIQAFGAPQLNGKILLKEVGAVWHIAIHPSELGAAWKVLR